jgi:hypothetical protein
MKVQGMKFWFFLFFFYCQGWLQCLSKIFDLWSSCCLLLHSSHHFGSSHLLNFLLLPNLSCMWPPHSTTCFSWYCLYLY